MERSWPDEWDGSGDIDGLPVRVLTRRKRSPITRALYHLCVQVASLLTRQKKSMHGGWWMGQIYSIMASKGVLGGVITY